MQLNLLTTSMACAQRQSKESKKQRRDKSRFQQSKREDEKIEGL